MAPSPVQLTTIFSVKVVSTSDLLVNKDQRLDQQGLVFESRFGVPLEGHSGQRDRRRNETGRQLEHDVEIMRARRRVVRPLRHAETLADAALERRVGGLDDAGELLLLAVELDDRHRPLPTGLGRRGVGRRTVRIDRDLETQVEEQRCGGHAHHAGTQHGSILVG
jgi:hypothetical protein